MKKGRIIFKLLRFVKNMWGLMFFAIFFGVLGFLSAIGLTFFGILGTIKLVDPTYFSSLELKYVLIIIATLGVLRGIFKCIEQYLNHLIAFKILENLRDRLFLKFRELGFTKLDNIKRGNLISLLTSDIETLEVFYAHTISPFFIFITTYIILSILSGIFIHYITAIILLLCPIIIGIILPFIYYRDTYKIGKKYRDSFRETNNFFIDSIEGIKEISLFLNDQIALKDINKRSNKLNRLNVLLKTNNGFNFSFSIYLVGLLAILVILMLSFFSFLTNGKDIVLFSSLFISSFGPALALASLPSFLNQTFVSAKRVFNLLAEKPLTKKIKNKNNFIFKNLKVENLKFGYNANNNVLNGVNFKVSKNEIIGIKGKSGSGKSTILKMLLRFYDRKEGKILYNGISIDDINTKSLKENVVLLSQSTYLFNDTIKKNLLIANKKATDKEMLDVLEKVNLDYLIKNKEKGLNEEIDEKSQNISSGEKQRIGLARVFLSKANLILLDEPTSNVDAINEGIILKSILENRENKTFVVISHKESTLSICDRVYNLKNGELTLLEPKLCY